MPPPFFLLLADVLADALLVDPSSLGRKRSGDLSGNSSGSQWLPTGAGGQQTGGQQQSMLAQAWGGGMGVPQAMAQQAFPMVPRPSPALQQGPTFLNGGSPFAGTGGVGSTTGGSQLGAATTAASGYGAAASAADWGTQAAAAQAATLQQHAGGASAAVDHLYPVHVITRFSLKARWFAYGSLLCWKCLGSPGAVTGAFSLPVQRPASNLHPPTAADFRSEPRPPAPCSAGRATVGAARYLRGKGLAAWLPG